MVSGGSHSDGGAAGELIEQLDRAITPEELDEKIEDGRRHLESGGARHEEVELAVERARLRREEM